MSEKKEEIFMKFFSHVGFKGKTTAAFLALSLGMISLSGCGGSGQPADTSKTASASQEATEGSAAAENSAGQAASGTEEDIAQIVVAYPTNGTIPQDLEMVQDAINEITIPEINTEVELFTVEVGSYTQQMNLMLSSGEKLDCMLTFPGGSASYSGVTTQGVFIPLDDLLEEYGQQLTETVGSDILQATTYQGSICGIPAYYDVAESVIWYMREDLLEKYGLTEQAQSVKSFDDMEAVLTVIAENESNISPIANAYIGGAILTTSDYYFLNGFDDPVQFDRLGDNTLQFANMMYTDERIVNLLNYGVEDVHYVDNGDGTISFPEGVTQENSGYYTFTYWFYGNGFIRKVWEGNDPDLLAEREQVLKDTPKSQSLAFSFDQTDYSMEMTQINNVIEQYRPGIESGSVDPETEIPRFLEALSAAGGDKYLAAYQEQLDAYYAEN